MIRRSQSCNRRQLKRRYVLAFLQKCLIGIEASSAILPTLIKGQRLKVHVDGQSVNAEGTKLMSDGAGQMEADC
jgi:hypothetical protein